MAIPRQTAYKVWISQILKGNFVKQEGFAPNYIEVNGKQISRVNILATVVAKFLSEDENYGTITLDDGTETIRMKAFGPDVQKIKNIKIGALVRAIGKVKQYEGEIYISPEVLRKVDDPNWIIVRRLLLGEPPKEEIKVEVKEDVEVEKVEENPSEKVLNLIKSLDSGEGANINEVIKQSKMDEEDAKNIIIGLLKSGDVFEPIKGKLKVLD